MRLDKLVVALLSLLQIHTFESNYGVESLLEFIGCPPQLASTRLRSPSIAIPVAGNPSASPTSVKASFVPTSLPPLVPNIPLDDIESAAKYLELQIACLELLREICHNNAKLIDNIFQQVCVFIFIFRFICFSVKIIQSVYLHTYLLFIYLFMQGGFSKITDLILWANVIFATKYASVDAAEVSITAFI
jgi:hypothetical protein